MSDTDVRALGVDLGSRRIGIALSDRSGTIASPLTVIARGATHARDHQQIAELVVEHSIDCVVVGLPLTMAGTIGTAARGALDEINEMSRALKVPVYTHDERLTTQTAHRSMMEAKMKAQARRRIVDKVAAAVMLQGWLDHADRARS